MEPSVGRSRIMNRVFAASRTRFALRLVITVLFIGVLLALARAQPPEQEPAEETPEAAIEPTPLPGTEIPLEPQLPPSEAPLPKRTLKLVPPSVVEPILPPVNFEALARSGRLWAFRGVVKEFRFVGNHVFSSASLGKIVEKYKNHEINAEDLEQARQDLTLLYINKGYVNSGAVPARSRWEKRDHHLPTCRGAAYRHPSQGKLLVPPLVAAKRNAARRGATTKF